MAIEGENLGVATIYLTVDKSSMDATIGKAKLELAGMGAEASKQYDAMSASQRKMAESMVRQAEMIGKTRAEQIAYNAQLKIGGALGDEIAQKAIANAQAQGAASNAAAAAQDKFAVSAAERAAQEERYAAVMAAERAMAVEDEAARAAAAEARAQTVIGADAAEFEAFNTTVRAKQALLAQLDVAMASGLTTQREIAAAEDALDAAMAGRALTQKEQLGYITALDAAEERLAKLRLASAETINVETASLDANTAAIKLNSRTQYEIGVLGGEIASGNVSRVKRSVPALLNATGLTTKLMSPAGLGVLGSAASVAALVVSYVQAEKEIGNFTRAIYASGQQGVLTADQMESLAGKVGDATGSYGDAAKALDALVSSGKYASDQYALLTRTLVNFQSLTGGSLQEGLQAIDSLNGQVGDGLVKLNGQYHFLTDTVYEQIAALQAEGKTEQARDLERKAFADGVNQSADDVKAHLDPLAKAWDAVGNAASDAWHKMGHGARENVNAAITGIQTFFRDIGDLTDRLKHPIATVMNGGLSPQEVARSQGASTADADAQKTALEKQATQTLAELDAEAEKFKSAAVRRAAQIVDVVNQTNAAIAKAEAAGNKKLADQIRAHGAALEEAIAARGAPGTHAPKARAAGGKTAADYLASFQDTYAKMVAKNGDALNKETAAKAKATVGDQAYNDQLQAELELRKNAISLQVDAVGMGQKEIQRMQERNQVYLDFNNKLRQLNNERDRGSISIDDYNKRLADLKKTEGQTVDALVNGWKQVDAAQANWATGAERAIADFHDQTADVATQTAGIFNTAFSDMTNALVTFVETGKLSFKSLVTDILKGIAEMEIKAAESKLFDYVGQLIGRYFGGGTTIDSGAIAAGNYTGPHAMGGVFDGPISPFATGGIVNSPTLFKFANGTGLMGEAGPEAIMPLTRGSDGKLGVKAAGGGNTTVIVENHSDNKAQVQQSKDSNGGDIIKVIVGQAVNEVNKNIARNGSTGQLIQQAFGLSRRGVPVAG